MPYLFFKLARVSTHCSHSESQASQRVDYQATEKIFHWQLNAIDQSFNPSSLARTSNELPTVGSESRVLKCTQKTEKQIFANGIEDDLKHLMYIVLLDSFYPVI